MWGISELTALLILGEILGVNVDAGFGDYVQLNQYIPAFKGFYLGRNDFEDYIDKTIQHMCQILFASNLLVYVAAGILQTVRENSRCL